MMKISNIYLFEKKIIAKINGYLKKLDKMKSYKNNHKKLKDQIHFVNIMVQNAIINYILIGQIKTPISRSTPILTTKHEKS